MRISFYCFLNIQQLDMLTKSSLKNPTFGTCCLEGKIKLPNLREPPEELKRLYEGSDELAKSFRRYIR
ncbi:hypothetical protein MKW94_024240, partial [Papaver nudicaule]|nr:hypothetical protein [Papaver nudicaule]